MKEDFDKEALWDARPGVLAGLEAITLAVQVEAGTVAYDDFIRAMPRTVKKGAVDSEAVAYAWLAMFAAKLLSEVVRGGTDTPAEYLQRCAETIYTLTDQP